MNESTNPESTAPDVSSPPERLPNGVPNTYADLVLDVIYGIHTSKIVFGQETGRELAHRRPVSVVAIPTSALVFMATKVISDLAMPAMVDETREKLLNHIQVLEGLRDSIAPLLKADE